MDRARRPDSLQFALAPDGRTFAGRFDIGEWWTGERLADTVEPHWPRFAPSPREVIRTVVAALNRFRESPL